MFERNSTCAALAARWSLTTLVPVALACLVTCALPRAASAEPANACKECGDHRKRCMANYPGPTCKIDYDICMKGCRKK